MITNRFKKKGPLAFAQQAFFRSLIMKLGFDRG
jgi:hypothetical protein